MYIVTIKYIINTIIITVLFVLLISSCSNENRKDIPKVVKGVLDLRNWDFDKDGIIKLDGEWEFYWQQFLKSKDFDTVQKDHFIHVPYTWKGYKWVNGEKLPGSGYATYRLKIILYEPISNAAIRVYPLGTNYKLLFNDSVISVVGKPGKTKETAIPRYAVKIYMQNIPAGTSDIVLQISNFHYWKGGLWKSINLGKEHKIRLEHETNLVIDFMFVGGLLLMSIYFLSIFFFRRKEIILLIWALICLTSLVRKIATPELFIVDIFPNINWEFLIKMELTSMHFAATIMNLYFYSLLKQIYSRKIYNTLNVINTLLVLFSIFTPAVIHSYGMNFFQVYTILMSLYIFMVSIIGMNRKIEGSAYIFVSMAIIIVALANTYLFVNYIINTFDTIVLGLALFFITQSIMLSNRISKSFEKVENFAKELELEVKTKTKDLRFEKDKSDKLLLNVLPESIANRLKLGETQIADHFEDASVIFIDIADFTVLSSKSTPQNMVRMLNEIFTIFDKIAAKYGIEKIKTIGDCYMAASGIPIPRSDHAEAIASMALEVMETMKEYKVQIQMSDTLKVSDISVKFRIGLDCGPIVAGVIGEQKFIYDLWGDMVNTASRMESNGVVGRIQCTERFKDVLHLQDIGHLINFQERGEIEIKGKGMMRTWFLEKAND